MMSEKGKELFDYFEKNIDRIDFSLLREFLSKELYNECVTEINNNLSKISLVVQNLYTLKMFILDKENEK